MEGLVVLDVEIIMEPDDGAAVEWDGSVVSGYEIKIELGVEMGGGRDHWNWGYRVWSF